MAFWNSVDRAWQALASVRLTIVLLIGLLLLSIPGTLFLQYNISSVDPGLQYDYDFWRFGQLIDLFQAYQSWWYVALLVLLSMNLIACSVERWPSMWKFATAKPVAWARETFLSQPADLRYQWRTPLEKDEALSIFLKHLRGAVVVEDGPGRFQLAWQQGRWARIANYLVHTSLLMVFAGGIISAVYGFEGAVNVPEGGAVDTMLSFKEGKGAGLKQAPNGLSNERLLGFRLTCDRFDVSFYKDFPGRPSDFVSQLRVSEIDGDKIRDITSKSIRVNDPLTYKNFTFYQASYGRMGDYRVKARLLDRAQPWQAGQEVALKLGEKVELPKFGVDLVLIQALPDVLGLGPGARWQEIRKGNPVGEPFWSLKEAPGHDSRGQSQKGKTLAPYTVVLDDVREMYFTGLQIAHDPGAPLYWFGCAGMLLGTFYALFITHRRYHLRFEDGHILFVGQIHRLPLAFREQLARLAQKLRVASKGTAV